MGGVAVGLAPHVVVEVEEDIGGAVAGDYEPVLLLETEKLDGTVEGFLKNFHN